MYKSGDLSGQVGRRIDRVGVAAQHFGHAVDYQPGAMALGAHDDQTPRAWVRGWRHVVLGVVVPQAQFYSPLGSGGRTPVTQTVAYHNATPGAVSSTSWEGHVGTNDDTAVLRLTENPTNNPGGLTGVWAEENTRESIFAALSRRETYATSGPRIVLRFYAVYGGADYCAAGAGGGGFPANVIAAGGVPMGGAMGQPPAGGTSPAFVVSALEDSADLAEVDVVKAAVVAGRITETIQRFTPSSPGTVWSSGSACVRWTDASFDPKSPAFYYARVLEVPTPRWSHYDCQKAPATPGCGADGGLDVLVQQRAWSSPVWWLP